MDKPSFSLRGLRDKILDRCSRRSRGRAGAVRLASCSPGFLLHAAERVVMTTLPRQMTRPNGRGRPDSRARREARWFYLFISPWLLGFVALSLFPLLFALFISFTNYDGL